MNLDAKKVVDVLSYLGDASAAGADEVGKAMQKASSSAQEAGVSFEWLGAYIATVSEKTRQAPESIGNAFNSIMSRLQSIKQMGFNEEDETKINDVAKALNSVGIELMGQDGQWRNMSDIFMDISLQWENMDDKARSYLATTMAGTRQKNVFFTLMNDMANVSSTTGEASRALELYYGALTSAGSASEKYAIYQESVEAAQANLKNSLESLYDEFLKSGAIKSYYNTLASLTDGFTSASEGAGKFVIAAAAAASAITMLTLAFSAEKAAKPTLTFLSFISSSKTILILTGVAAAIGLAASAFGA